MPLTSLLLLQQVAFLLQEGTPETTNFMIAGYIVFFLILIIYLVSLYARWRNLQQDMKMMEELEVRER